MVWFLNPSATGNGDKQHHFMPMVSGAYWGDGPNGPLPQNSVLDPYKPLEGEPLNRMRSLSYLKVSSSHTESPIHLAGFSYGRYLVLSQSALDILKTLQPAGWEAFRVDIRFMKHNTYQKLPEIEVDRLTPDRDFYLLNVYTQIQAVDIDKSTLEQYISNPQTQYARTIFSVNRASRVVLQHELANRQQLWHGADGIADKVFFVGNQLKVNWCNLGINAGMFFECAER